MADIDSQLIDQIKELNNNLKTILALVSNLSVQISKLDRDTKKGYALTTPEPAPEQNILRTMGYVNWNCSHDILKTKQWKELAIFTNYCCNISDRILEMDSFHVLDEQTRFPKDELFINISNPVIRAEILYIKTGRLSEKRLVERLRCVAKLDMHTRSSFEEKYGLTWIENPQNYQQEQLNTPNKLGPINSSLQKTLELSTKPLNDVNKNLLEDEQTQKLFEEFTSILNQLNADNFEFVLAKVNSLNINNRKRLEGVVDILYEKVIQCNTYLHEYVALCVRLSTMKVVTNDNQFVNFRKLIIGKCQDYFEASLCKLEKVSEKVENEIGIIDPTKKLRTKISKDNALGNIKFIGELYKNNLLTSNILNYILIKLTQELNEQNIEYVCVLLINLGKYAYNTDKFKQRLDTKVTLEKLEKILVDDSFNISPIQQLLIQILLENKKQKYYD